MILNFGKRKSIEITNADEITDLLANKLHAKNDEVMLLTQEVDKLGQEINELNRSREFKTNVIQEYAERIIELEEEKKQLIESNELANRVTDRLENQNEELRLKQHTPAKHKQEISKHKAVIKDLNSKLTEAENRAKENKNYREAYEFISNETTKRGVKDVFSHNLRLWMNENTLSDVSASELTRCPKETLRRLKTGSRGVTINTLQYFDEVLCNYFNCSVYELVSGKMEGKK